MLRSKHMKSSSTLLVLAIFLFLFGCQLREPETLPPEIVGVWESPAPKYKDCTLELTKEFVVFTSGEFQDHIDVNFIVKVEKKPERNHVLYTIHYENLEEQKYKFSFYYYPSKGGVMRLKNQKRIEWKKVRSIEG